MKSAFKVVLGALALGCLAVAHAGCEAPLLEISVEGIEEKFCAEAPICVGAEPNGNCPGPQEGLPQGSYCGLVASGVEGCIAHAEVLLPTEAPTIPPSAAPTIAPSQAPSAFPPTTPPTVEPTTRPTSEPSLRPSEKPPTSNVCAHLEGHSEVSVEGIEGIFCAPDQICVGGFPEGNCPGPQDGLPEGSHCGIVKSGVPGCKPGPAEEEQEEEVPSNCDDPEDGWSPVSVIGVGTFCARDQICTGGHSEGNCPPPQPGLESGSRCIQIGEPEVYGCVEGSEEQVKEETDNAIRSDAEEARGTTAPTSAAPTTASAQSSCKGQPGWTAISVEGVAGIFCAEDQICVGGFPNGNCPGPQDGLPEGSHCGIVSSGVSGCLPGPPPSPPTSSPPVDCDAEEGWSPVSVEGVEGVFCARDQICTGGHAEGNCPDVQASLPQGSHCALLASGVHGCREGPSQESVFDNQDNDAVELKSSTAATTAGGTSASTIIAAVAIVGAVVAILAVAIVQFRRKKAQTLPVHTPEAPESRI